MDYSAYEFVSADKLSFVSNFNFYLKNIKHQLKLMFTGVIKYLDRSIVFIHRYLVI